MRTAIRSMTIASLLTVLALATWGTAQDSKSTQPPANANVLQTTALRLAPADCSVFSTSLRLKDRLLSLWNTKAIQQIWNTPLVQAGWSEVTKGWQQQAGPMKGMLEQKENKELLQLLLDMASEECFMVGGPTLPNFLTVVGEAFGAAYVGAIGSNFNPGADQTMERMRAVLSAIQATIKDLQIPDVVVGFKVNDPKVAQRQVARLAVLLNAAALAVPQLTGNVKNQKINQFNLTTVTLDGAKMPWDKLPWDKIEENDGDFRDLRDHLKKMKITISIGYYDGYIVLGLGESLSFLERLGQGKKLAELPEFKPLLNHLDKRITGVSYSNKVMNSSSGFTKQQADAMVEGYMKLLEDSALEDDLRDRIEKDIKELGKDMLTMMGREPGPAMSFSFQTARGEESFHYQYSVDPRVDFTKDLSILQHIGGDPILAVLGRSVNKPQHWDIVVKWVKKGDGYFREVMLPLIEQTFGKDTVEQIEKVLDDMYPYLRRLDQTIRTNLCALTASNEHAIRLLQAQPLQIEGGPLADQKRKLGGAVVFKMSGLVETVEPWVDYILETPDMKDLQKHAKDIRTIMTSLKLFHTYSSATYLENQVTVTHSEWYLKDLP